MAKLLFGLILLSFYTLTSCQAQEQGKPDLCRSKTQTFMKNIDWSVNHTLSTATVNWTKWTNEMETDKCLNDTQRISVQLWRSDAKLSAKPTCNQLHPGNEVTLHQQKELVKQNLTRFEHVVGGFDYMIRFCPCQSNNRSHPCSCQHDHFLYQCSRILKPGSDENQVFQWCKGGNDASNSKMTARAPIIDCNGAKLSGTVTSCTPIQSYDKVRVKLYERTPEESNCSYDDHQIRNEQQLDVFLERINKTTGNFYLEKDNLDPEKQYCVVIELLDHPYCQMPTFMVGGPSSQPAVCKTHIGPPIQISKCSPSSDTYKSIKKVANFSNQSIVIVSVLVLATLIIIGLIVLCVCRRNNIKNCLNSRFKRKYRMEPSMANQNLIEESKSIVVVKNPEEPRVFLLSFTDDDDIKEINRILRQWVQSLGIKVIITTTSVGIF